MPTNIIRMSTAEYLRAVGRCRRTHEFYFLDLPKSIRNLIYQELWLGNTVNACSWLKDHEGEFAEEERCQLLLTCRAIRQEATGWFYFLSRWKFRSISSFQYFTWPDKACEQRWANITKITLSNVDILEEFQKHVQKFKKLQMLTIDTPHQFLCRASRRARGPVEQQVFVTSILSQPYYVNTFQPYLFVYRKWEASIVIQITYDFGLSEVCASLNPVKPSLLT